MKQPSKLEDLSKQLIDLKKQQKEAIEILRLEHQIYNEKRDLDRLLHGQGLSPDHKKGIINSIVDLVFDNKIIRITLAIIFFGLSAYMFYLKSTILASLLFLLSIGTFNLPVIKQRFSKQ